MSPHDQEYNEPLLISGLGCVIPQLQELARLLTEILTYPDAAYSKPIITDRHGGGPGRSCGHEMLIRFSPTGGGFCTKRCGGSTAAAAQRFKVGEASVYRWLKPDGVEQSAPGPQRSYKLDWDKLRSG